MPQTESLVVGGQVYKLREYSGHSTVADEYIGPDGVRYRLHANGGGLVALTAYAESTVHVGPQCRVFGNAHITGNVRLTGKAQVGGDVIAGGSVNFAGDSYITSGVFNGNNKIVLNQKN